MFIVPLHCSQNLTLSNVPSRCLLPGNRVTVTSNLKLLQKLQSLDYQEANIKWERGQCQIPFKLIYYINIFKQVVTGF